MNNTNTNLSLSAFSKLFKDYLPRGRSLLYALPLHKSILAEVVPVLKNIIGESDPFLLLSDLIKHWLQELDSLILPTIVDEIQKAKADGTLHGSNPFERYNSYFRDGNNLTPAFKSLTKRYPVLAQLLVKYISSAIANLKVALERLLNDFPKLAQIFGISSTDSLLTIHPTDSDRHGNGQQVLIFEFEKEKLVYKPFGGESAQLFFDCCIQVGYPKTPRIFCSPNQELPQKYYWMEFVKHLPCTSESEVRQYFSNAGKLLCVSELLGLSDGHSDNLIASGSVPILIDTETIFRPQVSTFENELDTFEKRIRMTLLVQDPPVVGRQFDELHSAFQQYEEVKPTSVLHYRARNDFGDNISLINEKNGKETNKAVPIFNGQAMLLHERENTETFIQGFIEAKQNLIAQKDAFVALLSRKRIQARVILRPTPRYLSLLSALKQPRYLASEEDTRNFLRETIKNWNAALATDFADYEALLDSEVEQLMKLDVPAFYTCASDLSVYSSADLVAEKFFLQPTSLERSVALLDTPLADDDIRMLRDIASTKEKMRFDSNSFVNLAASLAGVKTLPSDDLFKGESGKLIIYAALASNDSSLGSERAQVFRTVATTLFNDLLMRLEKTSIKADGAGLGTCSALYALSVATKLLKYTEVDRLVDIALGVDETVEEIDLLGGAAGTILCLLAVESLVRNTTKGSELLSKIERLANTLMNRIDGEQWKLLTGASHGISGLVTSIHRLYDRTGEEKYQKFILKLIEREDTFYSDKNRNWLDMRDPNHHTYDTFCWCNGAPGIVAVRNSICSTLPEDAQIAWKLKAQQIYDDITAKFDHIMLHNQTLCCGSAGLIEVILSYKNMMGTEKIQRKVEEMTRSMFEVVLTQGTIVDDESLFQGTLGLVYILLRAQGFNASIVNWELPAEIQA